MEFNHLPGENGELPVAALDFTVAFLKEIKNVFAAKLEDIPSPQNLDLLTFQHGIVNFCTGEWIRRA